MIKPKSTGIVNMDGFKKSLVDDWVEIWNTYDLSKVPTLFLDDSRVTYFSSEKQGTVRGIDDLVEHHRGFGFVEGGKEQPNRLWLEDTEIDEFEGSAIVTAIWCFERGETGAVQRGPVTLVYVPTSDGARIVHANFGNY